MEAHVGGRSASYMTPDLIYEREGAGEIDGVGKTLAPGITPVSNLKGIDCVGRCGARSYIAAV